MADTNTHLSMTTLIVSGLNTANKGRNCQWNQARKKKYPYSSIVKEIK